MGHPNQHTTGHSQNHRRGPGPGPDHVLHPRSQAEALAILGHSFDSMWDFSPDDGVVLTWPAAAGDFADRIGGATLSANNGAAGVVGVGSSFGKIVVRGTVLSTSRIQELGSAAIDCLLADDLTIATMVGLPADQTGTRGIWGKVATDSVGYFTLRHHSSELVQLVLRDDTSTVYSASIAGAINSVWTPVTSYIKRASNLAGCIHKDGSASVDITGMTAITDTGAGNFAFFLLRDLFVLCGDIDVSWMAFSNNTLADPADLQARMERYFLR